MIIEKRPFGLMVTIPETDNNSEFTYCLTQVRTINNDCKYEQKLIAELEKKEKPLTDEFLRLAEEMERWFMKMNTPQDWKEYERKFGDFNRNYHDKLRELDNAIHECSLEYADRSKHGWCL